LSDKTVAILHRASLEDMVTAKGRELTLKELAAKSR